MSEKLDNRVKKCVWREAAELDIANGPDNPIRTFPTDSKCISCDGYDSKCSNYAVRRKR